MYKNIEEITGKKACSSTGCLKAKNGDIIIDKERILERWVEYIEELFNDNRKEYDVMKRNFAGPPILKDEIIECEEFLLQHCRGLMSSQRVTHTKFKFQDARSDDCLEVIIPEVAEESYGLYIWPCSPVLAQYVWQKRCYLDKKHILELSAGTALPGIVAAKCGAVVTLSDHIASPRCLDRCRHSAETNSLPDVRVVGITWGRISQELCDLKPIDIILASDCFYDTKDFEDVLMTMAFLLENNPSAEIWVSYQERSSERSIKYLLDKWDLSAEELDFPNMDQLDSSYENYKAHVIELFSIRRKDYKR
ncbi:methyltransferase-like protein 23 [Elysia marginata]|uniref:Methyltransferase-like protein 23 n=1 Tax=Elysia marginata TaxID=1093978 RepID=A0AAV4F3F1_9GAST|nr:methyltransferase-like protein 23 [Elysia marginata]